MLSPPSIPFFGSVVVTVVVVMPVAPALVAGIGGMVTGPLGRNWFDASELLRRDLMMSV